MDREELIAALERHGTEGAGRAALALRTGISFQVWAGSTTPAGRLFAIWAWRAECLAEDGIAGQWDFGQGLPDLRRAGDTPVALGRVGMGEDSHLVFLTADLSSCVAVL
ncbi:hypothetical protein [Kitasatospora purpeofusca]|uniref:hypothetical protein n=1 Tax=Kitasatospora purpeofusca TaxID=67352 RepID=UPI002250D7F7|nr:hypothetical protein [Kitasatospora purpeofusca]MCX4757380.1 hypothetical protein [Kitasatospora purpeofusca]WSR34881.1 hypothetical protein OG715_30325 [Kitasatospora purpeofusca]WSR43099.1 hypothetical protein OG196_30835 [Kitasatospora purpeofusca]